MFKTREKMKLTKILKQSEETLLRTAIRKAKKGNVPLLIKLLKQIDEQKRVEALNTKEVLKLLKRGKVSINEAKTLMSLLKDKAEIDELPKLLKQLEELERDKK